MDLNLILLIAGAVLGVLGWFLAKKNLLKNKAIEAIWIGVNYVQDAVVAELKKKNEDGKLTTEEIAEVKQLAIDKALEVAKGPVKDLLLTWGKDKLGAIITDIVQKNKPA